MQLLLWTLLFRWTAGAYAFEIQRYASDVMPGGLKYRLRNRLQAVKLDVENFSAFLAYHVVVVIGAAVKTVGAVRDGYFKEHSRFAQLIQITVDRTQTQVWIIVFQRTVDFFGSRVHRKFLNSVIYYLSLLWKIHFVPDLSDI